MIVPVRAAPLFAPAVNATVPFPVPEAPLVTVIHPSFAAAVQAQDAPVVTLTEPDVAPSGIDWLVGAIEYVHAGGGGGGGGGGGAGADCVTVNVCPATVSVPVRAAPVFPAAVKFTDPLPEPEPGAAIDSQPSLAVAVHAHPAAVLTLTEPPPPLASIDWLVGVIE